MKKKINRLFYKIDTIFRTIFFSKCFAYDGYKVTYYFKKKKSDNLVVVFSAFQSAKHPHYNYIQTLRTVNCNQLFILDNFNKTGLGSYYLGIDGNYFIPNLVEKLIIFLNEKHHFKTITLCGSSKGGTSAIIHGLSYKTISVDNIIIGSPQYRLGTFLFEHGGSKKLLEISGSNDLVSKEKMDGYIENLLKESKNKPFFYILDSSHEDEFHVWDCKEFVNDLKKYKFCYEEYDALYEGHKSITEPWKKYWIEKLKDICHD